MNISEELIEHVAKAILTAGSPYAVWERQPEAWREECRAKARAAIVAVNEMSGRLA